MPLTEITKDASKYEPRERAWPCVYVWICVSKGHTTDPYMRETRKRRRRSGEGGGVVEVAAFAMVYRCAGIRVFVRCKVPLFGGFFLERDGGVDAVQ